MRIGTWLLIAGLALVQPSPAAARRRKPRPRMPEDGGHGIPRASGQAGGGREDEIPSRVQEELGTASWQAEQAGHETVARLLEEQREVVRRDPSNKKEHRKLLAMLSRAGRAHEAAHNSAAAAAVLREMLALEPPPEVRKWDQWEVDHKPTASGSERRTCVRAQRMDLALPPLELDPALYHADEDEDHGSEHSSRTGAPELHVSDITRNVFKHHIRRNAPLVIRGGAAEPQLCSITATSLRQHAMSELVKVAFPHPSSPEQYTNASTFLDELYLLHNVSDWNVAAKRIPSAEHERAAALLQSPVQWMRFSTFLQLATDPPTEREARRANLFQTSVPTQLPALQQLTPVPSWASKSLGAPVEHNLWLGSGGTVSRLHFDEYDNIIAAVRGPREVLLFPPSARAQLRFGKAADLMPVFADGPSPNGDSAQEMRVKVGAKLLSNFALRDHLRDNHVSNRTDEWPAGVKVTLEPGDALFLPAFWPHAVHQSAGRALPDACETREAEDGKCLSIAFNWWFEPVVTEDEAERQPWKSGTGRKRKTKPKRSRDASNENQGEL